MGMASVVVIMNDYLHEMRDDPDAGKKIAEAITYIGSEDFGRDMREFRYGAAVCCSHVSGNDIVIRSDYRGERLSSVKGLPHSVIRQLREALERSGYRVTKRRKPPLRRDACGADPK
jgi:hypothetical protein